MCVWVCVEICFNFVSHTPSSVGSHTLSKFVHAPFSVKQLAVASFQLSYFPHLLLIYSARWNFNVSLFVLSSMYAQMKWKLYAAVQLQIIQRELCSIQRKEKKLPTIDFQISYLFARNVILFYKMSRFSFSSLFSPVLNTKARRKRLRWKSYEWKYCTYIEEYRPKKAFHLTDIPSAISSINTQTAT